MERVVWHPINDLKPFPGNPRRHPESQIAGLVKSIQKVWTNPILIDETRTILAESMRGWRSRKSNITPTRKAAGQARS